MNKFFTRLLLFVGFLAVSYSSVHAQGKYTISGYIKDTANAESLLSASVYIVELGKGTNFWIQLKRG